MNGYRVCMTLVYCRFDKYLVQKWVHVYANYTGTMNINVYNTTVAMTDHTCSECHSTVANVLIFLYWLLNVGRKIYTM